MTGQTDGSVLNDDSDCPGRGSRTPAVRARSSSSQPEAVGSAAPRPARMNPDQIGHEFWGSDSKLDWRGAIRRSLDQGGLGHRCPCRTPLAALPAGQHAPASPDAILSSQAVQSPQGGRFTPHRAGCGPGGEDRGGGVSARHPPAGTQSRCLQAELGKGGGVGGSCMRCKDSLQTGRGKAHISADRSQLGSASRRLFCRDGRCILVTLGRAQGDQAKRFICNLERAS